jgi:hypothetical protein
LLYYYKSTNTDAWLLVSSGQRRSVCTHFTCFTSAKVRILTKFTCFTITKVQILTLMRLQVEHVLPSEALRMNRDMQV